MNAYIPATGNYASPALWIGIIVVAVAALFVILFLKKKK